jgi:hypothetical protein
MRASHPGIGRKAMFNRGILSSVRLYAKYMAHSLSCPRPEERFFLVQVFTNNNSIADDMTL